jgi:hypothetical protein
MLVTFNVIPSVIKENVTLGAMVLKSYYLEAR